MADSETEGRTRKLALAAALIAIVAAAEVPNALAKTTPAEYAPLRVMLLAAACMLLVGVPMALRGGRLDRGVPPPLRLLAGWRDVGWLLGLSVVLVLTALALEPLLSLLVRKDSEFGTWRVLAIRYHPQGQYIYLPLVLVVGPLAEEIFYRGFLLARLRGIMPTAAAVLLQAALFGLGHLPSMNAAVLALWMGLVLGLARWCGAGLLCLAGAHAAFNTWVHWQVYRFE